MENPDWVYLAWLYDGTLPNDDTTGPDFGTATSVSIACGSIPGVLADPTDPCGIASLTYEDTFNGTGGCTGSNGILRTYTAVDGCGNTSTFVQELVFVDVDPPVFEFVPGDLSITCDEGDIPLDPATATDDCSDATVTVSLDIVGGPCPEPYEIVRVFTATDACGNTTTATQTIFITNDPLSDVPRTSMATCSSG